MPAPATPTPQTVSDTPERRAQLSDARLSAVVEAAYILRTAGR
jgi:hypothetical protein